MTSYKEDLKTLLLQLSYEKRVIRLASGRESDFYFDGKQTSLHPRGALLLGHCFWKLLSCGEAVTAIGGPALGACPLVTAISVESERQGRGIPAFIVRKEPKSHGTTAWIEGVKNLQPGMAVALVEDVVTTGGSLLKAIDRVEAEGYNVRRVLTIVDREEGGKEAFAARGLVLESLFTKSELIGTAQS